MKISIYGTGYVGLVTGACLADAGHEVLCMDVDKAKIARLDGGDIPIYEPGLNDVAHHNALAGRLRFGTDAAEAACHGVLQFIAVGTPSDEDGSADMKYVRAVARQIGKYLAAYAVVITKSTVPVGTAELVRGEVQAALVERSAQIAFDVASNPEFLKEGTAVEDFNKPDRVVVGADSERVRELMRECYAPFTRNHDNLMFVDIPSAELTKYAANGMLATKISFMNEIANIAERVGADVESVRRGIGSDPRIGYHFIYPGCGYGGSCFPKDLRALNLFAREAGYDAPLIRAVEDVNNRQKTTLFAKLNGAMAGQLEGAVVAVWGLAFKPNTDDMRDAPSRVLIEALWAAGATVQAYDPEAMREAERIWGQRPDLRLVHSKDAALEGAQALVICTEWKEFRAQDADLFVEKLGQKLVVDGRNLYDPKRLRALGLDYRCVGRPA